MQKIILKNGKTFSLIKKNLNTLNLTADFSLKIFPQPKMLLVSNKKISLEFWTKLNTNQTQVLLFFSITLYINKKQPSASVKS